MYRLLNLCIALFFTSTLLAQSSLQVKKDSVKVRKAELVIENGTKDSLGFLYNNGSGQTSFKKIRLVNIGDSALAIVGQDTLLYKGGSHAKSVQFKVGASNNAPLAGDSIYTNSAFIGNNIKVWKNGLFQYRDELEGITVDSLTGKIIFHPVLAQGDKIYIESQQASLTYYSTVSVLVRDTAINLPNTGLSLSGVIAANGATITGYQWTQLSGPTTSTITNSNAATCTITGLGGGTYTYRFTITTSSGLQVSDDFIVQVTGTNTLLRVNFSASAATPISGWFNVYGPVTGKYIAMTDTATGWTINNVSAADTVWKPYANSNAGDTVGAVTGNNSGIVPDAVLASCWYNYDKKYNGADNLYITGLNPAKTYKLQIVGSRSLGAAAPRYGAYRVNGGSELLLNASNNTSQGITVDDVAPDSSGRIRIAVYAPVSATYGSFSYINALIIEQK